MIAIVVVLSLLTLLVLTDPASSEHFNSGE
jgi:hypothetical protein